jgi:hypothetical protein
MGILFSFHSCPSDFETDREQELVKTGDDASVEAVELGTAGIVQLCIGAESAEDSGSQRSIDAFKKLQEHHADGVTVGKQPITA